jgi:hypothetical protein
VHAFLDPARRRPNLRIETEALATRVLLDGKRAVGVAYLQRGEVRDVRCSGEVILSAGAVKSPHLLERVRCRALPVIRSVHLLVDREDADATFVRDPAGSGFRLPRAGLSAISQASIVRDRR